MPESPPTEVWVDEHVTVRRSAIEGHGLIAVDDIPEGTIVVRLGGRLVDSRHLAELIAGTDREPDAPYVDTITIDEDVHLVLPAATIAHFGNHSCDPTMWHVSTYELATRRPVRAGEELTLDYGTNSGAEGFALECGCGSVICRGRVTSDDWRVPELRQRYEGHWSPALQRRIDRS